MAAYVTTTTHLGGGTATLTPVLAPLADAIAWVEAHRTTTVALRCARARCTATYTKHLTAGDEEWRTRFSAAIDGWDCTEDDTDYCPDHTGDLR